MEQNRNNRRFKLSLNKKRHNSRIMLKSLKLKNLRSLILRRKSRQLMTTNKNKMPMKMDIKPR
jgi:hypothetical protein